MSTPETIEKITAQILNKRYIKKLANHCNIELRKESKEFVLDAAESISNEKVLQQNLLIKLFEVT